MRVLIASLFVVIADQISKFIVKGISIPLLNINLHGMFPGQKIPIAGNFFDITFVENPGIAFGINFGDTFKFFIAVFSIIACALLILYLYKNRHKPLPFRLAVALIIGGALGNLFDRIFYGVIFGYGPLFYGNVVDFFNIKFFNIFIFERLLGSYVFNIADVAVTTGVLLLLYSINKQRAAESGTNTVVENYLAENKE